MISFKANLVNNTNVKCLNKNGTYKNMPVNLVELDIDSDLDLEALEKVKENWKKGDVYARDIFAHFKEHYEGNLSKNNKNIPDKFYALTSQYGGYNNLDSSKILGVAQIYKEVENYLELTALQTNPKYRYGSESREIKHIGKAIVNSLKTNFKNDSIFLFSTEAGKPLYEKLGFKTIRDTMMILKR